MKKIIALSILLSPFVAFASFWNPFTWFNSNLGASWTPASVQVGTTPSSGYVLQTNGITSSWVATSTLGIGGSQTPWTSNIDGGGYSLSNVATTTTGELRMKSRAGFSISENATTKHIAFPSLSSIAIGNRAMDKSTSVQNTAIGYRAAYMATTGGPLTGIGNTMIGTNVMFAAQPDSAYNTAVGAYSLHNSFGTSSIAIGYYSGAYNDSSDSFYINNRNLTNTAGDKAYSLLYGKFGTGASTVGQQLTVNAATTTINGDLTVTGIASSTSLFVSDNFVTVGSKKIYSDWEDLGISIAQPTTTDEVYKPMLKCLPPGSPSITIENVYGIIASTTSTLAENLEGMTFNINIAQSPSSTTPMTVFSTAPNLYSTSSQQTFTPTGTATIPSGYCYWWTFPTASSSQIGVAGFGLTGKKN